NATLEDTGGRLAIGTTDLADKRGVKNFGSIYGNVVDPSVVTAARLSATFTYVSPAARIDAPALRTRTYHVVDGGYFDNYGIASAVDWLAAGLAAPAHVKHVLVVQIRGQIGLQDPAARPARGLIQQVTAPLTTLLHYRDAAQIGHNNTELQLLCDSAAHHGVTLENAVFEYPKSDTPLSWHLTSAERDEVWQA